MYLHSFSGDYTVSAEMNRLLGSSSYSNAILLCTSSSKTSAYGYWFIYRTNGMWGIWRFGPYNFVTDTGTSTFLKSGASAAIKTGLDKWNILKVVKSGSSYSFLINGISLHTFSDSTYNPTYLMLHFHCGEARPRSVQIGWT